MATAFLAEVLEISDPEAYARYRAAARPIVEAYAGVYVLTSGKVSATSPGTPTPERVVLIRFPDTRALRECFSSPEYLAVAPLRERSTTSRSFVLEDV